MAAAFDLVDVVAVKAKGRLVERSRPKVQGAFGSDKRSEIALKTARDREAGKLDEQEKRDLSFLWGGYESALGVRSVQAAIEDALMRSPPRLGEEFERAVLEELRHKGRGVERGRLIEMLAQETATDRWGRKISLGATRREGMLCLRGMVGKGLVEFYTEEVERPVKMCRCRLQLGEYEGTSPGAPPPRRSGECRCGTEVVPTPMVRLAPEQVRLALQESAAPPTPEERWRRADEELERFCRTVDCKETRSSGGGGVPPHVRAGRADATRSALARMAPRYRKVLERVYGSGGFRQYAGVLSEEAERLAPMLECVEAARRELARERGLEKGLGPTALLGSTYGAEAIEWRLFKSPEGEVEKIRYRLAREAFVERLEKEATALLKRACESYREQRGME